MTAGAQADGAPGAAAVELDPGARDHLDRLLGEWSMLADFCFSDLVLYVRAPDGRYVMAHHVRPATSQTIYPEEVVGNVRTADQRPLIDLAFRTGAVQRGDIDSAWLGERVRVDAIPVRHGDRVVAVLAREFLSAFRTRPGELEQTYEQVFGRFAAMIAAGTFPFPRSDVELATSPRVGDGVVVLDADAAVVYRSPNATSTLARAGADGVAVGSTFAQLGIDMGSVRSSFASGRPTVEELDRPGDITVVLRCLPFVDAGRVTGAVVLLRDISDLRRRDRLLLSKDATISEIHHRVKNNLQTISSLLRLQARGLDEPSARAAVEESVRRIQSIALVHETLSREPGDDVEFRDVLRPLVRMVNEGLVSAERPIRFEIEGLGGVVASEVATSLSLVVVELLQNAVEHAFPEGRAPAHPLVRITLRHDTERIVVQVADNGVGLAGAQMPSSSLGRSIVEALVRDEMRGTIEHGTGPDGTGTVVRVDVASRPSAD